MLNCHNDPMVQPASKTSKTSQMNQRVLAVLGVLLVATVLCSSSVDAASTPTVRAPKALGRIKIPSIGIDQPLNLGVSEKVLSRGFGLWPGTAQPGEIGNTVIGGHRTSHTKPLADIHKIKVGARIYFTIPTGLAVYQVTKTKILKPRDTWILRQGKTATATFFSCHPPHFVTYRYVVFAKLERFVSKNVSPKL